MYVIHVTRSERRSEKMLKATMAALAVLFLLGAVAFNRGLMLPCFLMAAACFIYAMATKRQYEYILENGQMRIDRLTDYGRRTRHQFSLQDIEVLASPADPRVLPYKKGGGVRIKKYDYTSYQEGVAWYTMIVREDGRLIKLLLDLDERAIDMIRRENRAATRI